MPEKQTGTLFHVRLQSDRQHQRRVSGMWNAGPANCEVIGTGRQERPACVNTVGAAFVSEVQRP
jgi:hypothetical protein